MDVLTLKAALKLGAGLDPAFVQTMKDYTDTAVTKVDMDKDTAVALLINAFRQHVWDYESQRLEDLLICEEGNTTLNNALKFPFNDSISSVSLAKTQEDTNYVVHTEITASTGNAGEIVVSDKQLNGFKLAYTGSASSITVHYIVIGGLNL